MALDLRPPMAPALEALGLAIVVTRPAPESTPVATTGIWLTPLFEEQPYGSDLRRRDPRRLMGIARTADLDFIPRGSLIDAPEQLGGVSRTWMVEGYDRVIADEMRVLVLPAVNP